MSTRGAGSPAAFCTAVGLHVWFTVHHHREEAQHVGVVKLGHDGRLLEKIKPVLGIGALPQRLHSAINLPPPQPIPTREPKARGEVRWRWAETDQEEGQGQDLVRPDASQTVIHFTKLATA